MASFLLFFRGVKTVCAVVYYRGLLVIRGERNTHKRQTWSIHVRLGLIRLGRHLEVGALESGAVPCD